MIDVSSEIREAQKALDTGKNVEAFRHLDMVVTKTADLVELKQIYQLASRGYEEAGFFRKHMLWKSLVKAAEQREAELEG